MNKTQLLEVIEKAEKWANDMLVQIPEFGISIHTLEQLAYLRKALDGDAAAIQYIKSEFDLGLMAAKELEVYPEDAEAADMIHEISFYVEKNFM